jgi:hypothetical protein
MTGGVTKVGSGTLNEELFSWELPVNL